ncbi:MAG: DUF853 family protein [Candidatus Heimdallarchaeota archaeon]|nr:DUF853 family protein [Candidatus Heimdallarchaeota archaeon]
MDVNDLLQFSLADITLGLSKYTIEVKLISDNDQINSYIILSKSRRIIPYSISAINQDLEKQEFFYHKNPVIIENNSKLRHNRYFNFNLETLTKRDDIRNVNLTQIKSIIFQQNLQTKIGVSFKFKKLSKSRNYTNLLKDQVAMMAFDNITDDDDLFAYSLLFTFDRKRDMKFFTKKLKELCNINFTKKYKISLIRSTQTQILNYHLINSLKQVLVTKSELKSDSLTNFNLNQVNPNLVIGSDINNNKFEIDLVDVKQGGIISGAIGTGKTTLRLTLMEQLIQKGITILDIDYKGDAPRLFRFFRKGMVLVPGKNLHIDIFDQPPNVNSVEFVGILYRSFVESVTDGELTPPQKHILLEAIRKTLAKRGNLESFYRNIVIASVESKEVIDNYQQQTAIALINKFNWLQSTMRNVFGVNGHSVSAEDLARNNVFLDLSYIQQSAPNHHIRFFLDMLITKLMLYYKNKDSENFSKSNVLLRKVIFLDETHMFMPNHRDKTLSRLEELVVTLRHKGLSVIATTTNPAFISDVFLDASFLAQFRTESSVMQRSMGLTTPEFKSIVQLPNYFFYLKSTSTNHQLKRLQTAQFIDNSLVLDEYNEVIMKYDVTYLDEFRIEPGYFEVALLESYIFNSLPIEPYRRIIRPIVKKYLTKYYPLMGKITKENSYHQILLQSYTDYLEDDSNIPELGDTFYIRCFLYELLLFIFLHNFRNTTFEKATSNSINKKFRYSHKIIFLNLITFIDQLVKRQLVDDIF